MAEPTASEGPIAARLAAAELEFRDLEARLADPELASDPAQLRIVATRYRELGPLVAALVRPRRRRDARAPAEELLVGAGPVDRQLLEVELDAANEDLAAIDDELQELLLLPDPHAGRAVILDRHCRVLGPGEQSWK